LHFCARNTAGFILNKLIMQKQLIKKKMLHFAIYLKDCNPSTAKKVKEVNGADRLGKIINPFEESKNGGDLALYFLGAENTNARKELKEEILLHLLTHMPKRIYKAPKRDMTLGEYAVQQCMWMAMDPAEYLPDSCWLALMKKGSTQFDEVRDDPSHPFHKQHRKILNHLTKISATKLKASLEEELAGDYGDGDKSGRM
jgi:hypothetical protein